MKEIRIDKSDYLLNLFIQQHLKNQKILNLDELEIFNALAKLEQKEEIK